MKIIFFGTPKFAQPSLRALSDSGYRPLLTVTRPDKPKGRGRKLEPPPVALLAREMGIPVWQPSSPREEGFFESLKALAPDLLAVVAYGHILKKNILDLPRLGCVNLHASLLPKYRGASPINWAIIRGEKTTGVTTMILNERMDEGDVLLQRETAIGEEETAGELAERLSGMGAELLVETVKLLEAGKAPRRAQDPAQASLAPKLSPGIRILDWSQPARQTVDLIRGLSPEPGTVTRFRGTSLKVLAARLISGEKSPEAPGTVLEVRKGQGPVVAAGEGSLLIARLQMEGKREMDGASFLNGYRVAAGEALG